MQIGFQSSHGAVLAVVAGVAIVHNGWMTWKVGQARRKFKVPYPNLYAPPGHQHEVEFNCIQRGHQNALEHLPTVYAMLLTAGIRFPISASIAGVVTLLGRIMYFQGYSTGDPKARYRGIFAHYGTLANLCMVLWWSAELLAPALGR